MLARTRPLFVALLTTGCTAGWTLVDDAPDAGSLSGIWGSAADDIFAVGGNDTQGTVLHFDGTAWSPMDVPEVDLLVWVFGFGPDNVYAVGESGGMVHYDGSDWTRIDTGTDEDLWGIWGRDDGNLWIVGGSTGTAGDPVLMNYDGATFTPVTFDSTTNRNDARSLFKVWGVGDRTFAVGARGWILSYDGTTWTPENTGPEANDDFVALWGADADTILAVGGRSNGLMARFDGSGWTSTKPTRDDGTPVPGLNAVFTDSEGTAVIGGINGWVGTADVGTGAITDEGFQSNVIVHAAWGDGAGTTWVVGGSFTAPHTGEILVRQ